MEVDLDNIYYIRMIMMMIMILMMIMMIVALTQSIFKPGPPDFVWK